MPKSRIILALGFFIALLPVLGFPNSWDHFFDTATGLLIVLLSVLISVDRRLMLKAKAEKRTQRKRALVTPRETVAEPVLAPEPEPEPVSIPSFSMPEPIVERHVQVESIPEPIIEMSAEAPHEHRPHKRRSPRKMRVLDGDVQVVPIVETSPEAPAVEETFDTTEF